MLLKDYSYLEIVFKNGYKESKLFLVDSFNLNCLDYIDNLEIQTFYNRIFAHDSIPLITRPTRVTSKTVSLIGNIYLQILFWHLIETQKINHFPVFVSLTSSSKIHKEKRRLLFTKELCMTLT